MKWLMKFKKYLDDKKIKIGLEKKVKFFKFYGSEVLLA